MNFLLKFFFLCWLSNNNLINGIEILYRDLQELNATCFPDDTCLGQTYDSDSPHGVIRSYSCSCSRLCSMYDTCCIDLHQKRVTQPKLKPTCRKLGMPYSKASYFMVDKCRYNGTTESVWENLCNDEWDGENDVLRLVPVTSLFTSLTYKNYFCLKCHEKHNDFMFWNIFLGSYHRFNVKPEIKHDQLTYSSANESWIVPLEESDTWITVDLKFQIPKEIWSLPVECESDLISHCDDKWLDDIVRNKCNSYKAVIYILKDGLFLKYRNPHCALCNFETLDEMFCKSRLGITSVVGFDWGLSGIFGGGLSAGGSDGGHGAGGSDGGDIAGGYDRRPSIEDYNNETQRIFDFTDVLDINKMGVDKVSKIQMCEENVLWDPFSKACRSPECALPGNAVKDGKCMPP